MAGKRYGRGGILAAIALAAFLPFAAESANLITGIRVADRDGATRIVIDSSDKTEFDLKNLKEPPQLIIGASTGKWHGKPDRQIYKSWLVKEIISKQKNSGAVFYIKLNSAARFKQVIKIPPKDSTDIYRLAIDIIPQENIYKGPGAPEIKLNFSGSLPDKKEKIENVLIEKPKDITQPLSMQRKKNPEQVQAEEIKKLPPAKADSSKFSVFKAAVPIPVLRPSKPVIVIDPGHGGNDPGAISQDRVFEKDITLKYARALKEQLLKTGKYKVVLTRNKDEYVALKERTLKAKQVKADLLISLHADSNSDINVRGLSVYTLSANAAEKQMAKISRRIDKPGALAKIDLSGESKDTAEVVLDLVSAENRNASARFAEAAVKELGSQAKLLENSHRFAGYMVLTGIDVPSVLIELGYLSNPYEEKALLQNDYRKKLLGSLERAINKYFNIP